MQIQFSCSKIDSFWNYLYLWRILFLYKKPQFSYRNISFSLKNNSLINLRSLWGCHVSKSWIKAACWHWIKQGCLLACKDAFRKSQGPWTQISGCPHSDVLCRIHAVRNCSQCHPLSQRSVGFFEWTEVMVNLVMQGPCNLGALRSRVSWKSLKT